MSAASEIRLEYEALRIARGRAFLDGRPFNDSGRLDALADALQVAEDAEAEEWRRRQAADAAAERERIEQLHEQIHVADAERLVALRDAQKGFSYACNALAKVIELTAQIRVAGVQLRGPSSLALEHSQAERRISRWLAAGLTEIGRIQEFGDITWHGTPPLCADWAAAEREAAGPAVALLLDAATPAAEHPLTPISAPFTEPQLSEPDAEDTETRTERGTA